jgi:polyisoprenoid-binding protein YceI
MNKLILTAALVVSSLASASDWTIDSAHSLAEFDVKHMAVSTVNGSLGEVTGAVKLDDKDASKSTFDVKIDVKGLTTKVAKRDDHLRSADFFDVEKFPTITFVSKKADAKQSFVKIEGTKATITGVLTIKGVSKDVTLTGTLADSVNPFTKAKTRGFTATTQINRKDFGLVWNMALETGGVLVSDEVNITVNAELVPAAPAAAPAAAPTKK